MLIDQQKITQFLCGYEGHELVDNITEIVQSLVEMENIYQAAIKEIKTKLEILDEEFQVKDEHNPIHQIQTRVKTPKSILDKLTRKGMEVSRESARENLNDIAGIRIICPYIDDIYKIANLLKTQNDIVLIKETNYIKNPKPNGYRSLHMVLVVPVFFSDRVEKVKVEIQIRTIAMDFWASLQHRIYYKASGDIPEEIYDELKECADIISATDMRMQNIHTKMDHFIDIF